MRQEASFVLGDLLSPDNREIIKMSATNMRIVHVSRTQIEEVAKGVYGVYAQVERMDTQGTERILIATMNGDYSSSGAWSHLTAEVVAESLCLALAGQLLPVQCRG